MKKVFLMLSLIMIGSFAQAETTNEFTFEDSTRTYNKGEMVITAGATTMGIGFLSLLYSRYIGVGTIATGGVITIVGVLISRKEKNNHKGNKISYR